MEKHKNPPWKVYGNGKNSQENKIRKGGDGLSGGGHYPNGLSMTLRPQYWTPKFFLQWKNMSSQQPFPGPSRPQSVWWVGGVTADPLRPSSPQEGGEIGSSLHLHAWLPAAGHGQLNSESSCRVLAHLYTLLKAPTFRQRAQKVTASLRMSAASFLYLIQCCNV